MRMTDSSKFARALKLPEPLRVGQLALASRQIEVSYGNQKILNGVSFNLYAGEVLALVGPNGAGKSTLLDVLTGDVPASGEVEIVGTPIAEWKVQELARQRAVLTQQNNLSFPFTVLEVVEMGRAPWQRTSLESEDEESTHSALALTETEQFSHRRYPSLSGGEKARVSLARILAQRTGIIFLDEPTAALDLKHQEDVLKITRQLADSGHAVVVVLHDLNLAAAYADRVMLLNQGAVYAIGSPREVLTAEAIHEVYQHPVEIITHPVTGNFIVIPIRS